MLANVTKQYHELFESPSKWLELIYNLDLDVKEIEKNEITERHKQMVTNLLMLQYVNIPDIGIFCVECSKFQMEQNNDIREFVEMELLIKHRPYDLVELNILLKLYFIKCIECDLFLAKTIDIVLQPFII